jgi:hypothetical protein
VPAPPAAGANVILTPPEVAGSGKLSWVNPLALKFVPFTTKMLPWAMLRV